MNKSKEGLLAVNENSIFYKIKNFFKRLFFKSESLVKEEKIEEIYNNEIRDKLSTFLSNDECVIIKYIYFDRLKMKEIADIIGSTESAVKQKHYRICNKLRKLAKKFEKNY